MTMRKYLAIILAVLLLTAGGAFAAENSLHLRVAAVQEVRADGSILCLSSWNEFVLRPDDETEYRTDGDIEANMILFIYFDPSTETDGELPEITPSVIMDAMYEGEVINVDEGSSRVRIQTPSVYRVWVQMPATTDFSEVMGKTIMLEPYGVPNATPEDVVQTHDYLIIPPALTGTLQLEEDRMLTVLTADGQEVRVLLNDDTATHLSTRVGDRVEVYYSEGSVEAGEVTALTVWGGNG